MARVLGISGLFGTEIEDYPPDVSSEFFHDAAAALVIDGQVVAAIEEERFNREKHTNRFPLCAAAFCLEHAGLQLDQLDAVAYFFGEEFTDRELRLECLGDARLHFRSSRELIHERLANFFGTELPADRLYFVRHHLTHATMAHHDCAAERALVAVFDGNGESEGISFFVGAPDGVTRLKSYSRDDSLGRFYSSLTKFIGYRSFDEYKVMGLASYGDSSSLYKVLSDLCVLQDDGDYQLDVAGLPDALLRAGLSPRRENEDFQQVYADLAASGQRLIEEIATHLVRYWRDVTGLRSLCLAGGVAQNTTLNGKLLREGKFEYIYVHPAAHDGGASLGAAYAIDRELTEGPYRPTPLPDAYLGPALGADEAVLSELQAWDPFIQWEFPDDIANTVAELLASGEVIGWAQGRSEFGPRALGSRSILAAPSPASQRDRINALIKHREGYRPLAPAVLDAIADEFFVMPRTCADYSYMGFVVQVRESRREELGAITHVDGTARIQIAREKQHPIFWRLIKRFGELTGTPVLLNTSFNNFAEPIVQTPHDAITCLLTTDLRYLAVGRYLVKKRKRPIEELFGLRLSLAPFCLLETQHDERGEKFLVRGRGNSRRSFPIGRQTAELIRHASHRPRTVAADLLDGKADTSAVAQDVFSLWERRLIKLEPVS